MSSFSRFSKHFTRCAFTLVELLVVIGIIALLVGILLPALTRAREASNFVKCASNARQLSLAIRNFAEEHRGYMPAVSDHQTVKLQDPTRQIWVYRADYSNAGDPTKVYDWASSLLPYLGARGVPWFNEAGDKSKVFQCPSDRWQDMPGKLGDPDAPGFLIFNNMANPDWYYPISYGINADIGGQPLATTPYAGRLWQTGLYYVWHGSPASPTPPWGAPLNARFYKVYHPSETLLLADCGVRPAPVVTNTEAQQRTDILLFTTHMAGGGSLGAIVNAKAPLSEGGSDNSPGKTKKNIPWDRHRGKINVAFCDGHVDGVLKGDADKVRVSPFSGW